jgi:hypothetical protein
LSGTLGDAGGIGGLVLLTEHSGRGTNHFVCYDGNGNVTALVFAADGQGNLKRAQLRERRKVMRPS